MVAKVLADIFCFFECLKALKSLLILPDRMGWDGILLENPKTGGSR